MSPQIGRNLGDFHYRMYPLPEKIHPNRDMMVKWSYLPLDTEMKAVGLEGVETYILSCQNKTTQYIYTRTILDIFLEKERQLGERVLMIWWEKVGLDLGQGETDTDMDTEEEGEGEEDDTEGKAKERR